MAEDKVKDELYEMSKPLARYADDEDLERMLKEREREGDPMLKFMKKKPKLTPSGKPKKGAWCRLHMCLCFVSLSILCSALFYDVIVHVYIYILRRRDPQ